MADPEFALSKRLRAAAAALSGTGEASPDEHILHYFGYDNADDAEAPRHVRMLIAAATFRRLFRLPMPDSPGLVFFGAEADPADLGPHNLGLGVGGFAGSGLDRRRAFKSCVGEGIEYLSQFAEAGDPLQSATIAVLGLTLDAKSYGFVEAILTECGVSIDRALNWISVRRMSDDEPCWLPTDLCLRRAAPDFVPPLRLSTGCAAGLTPEDATLHAMLELIERDAVALWWRGGLRGRAIVPDSEAGDAAATLVSQVRQTASGRQTWLLDITTDLGIPVVAAFSTRQDGDAFALGMAARASLAEAARSAISEMCQSELSLHVIAAKRREAGEAALNESDRRQLARATLDPRTCLLLQPCDKPPSTHVALAGDTVEAILQRLAELYDRCVYA